jgi:hypothetical protein
MRAFIVLLGTMTSFALPLATPPRQSLEEAKLAGILQKAQEYCRRLDRAALDFVCQEDVKEEVNKASGPTASTVSALPPVVMGDGRMRASPAPVASFNTTSYLYDYQFIRKGTEVTERRDLLEKNGVRFPSLDITEEAYSGGGSSKFIRSTTTVKYKSYKFFTVETETGIR